MSKMENRPIAVIVTGAGAPGIQVTLYSLKQNYDNRSFHVIGTDINDFVVGKYLCDEFCVISPAKKEEEYLSDLMSICKDRNVKAILPQNTAELLLLAKHKKMFSDIGVGIVVSNYDAIEKANNKYKLFQIAESLNIPVAKYSLVSTFTDLKNEAIKLGWPRNKFVVKPPLSNGSRGVRVIAQDFDRKKTFYEEKPSSLYTTIDELHAVLGDEFPELIVMEYLPGEEYTVDVCRLGNEIIALPRKRLAIRSGITFAASLEKNDFLISASQKLAENLGLNFCFGFQYKLHEDGRPLLLESNPRIQGTMVMSTFAGANIIYNSVKYLLGETISPMVVNWETKLLRYWGALGIQNEKYVKI